MEPRRIDTRDRLALGWGVAEAAVFFVVPDVLLTYLAVRCGLRRGIRATWWALGGAVVGGLIAFGWGVVSPESANTAMGALPAIDGDMVDTVTEQVDTNGPAALMAGPLQGQPYKLYAAASGELGESPVALVLWTIPGRLWRFLGLTVLFGTLEEARRRWTTGIPQWTLIAFWAIFWTAVYVRFWFG